MSKADKKEFFVRLGAITGIFAVSILACQWQNWLPIHPYVWWILLYNVLLTAGSFLMLRKGISGDEFDFYNNFMGNSAIRLLLSATLILIYFYQVNVENMNFTITFFIFYFTYTIFEIKHLLSNLRANSGRVHKQDEK